MNDFQNSTSVVPKHCLDHSNLSYHNKPRYLHICQITYKAGTYIIYFWPPPQYLAQELFANMSQFLKLHNITSFLSPAWDSPTLSLAWKQTPSHPLKSNPQIPSSVQFCLLQAGSNFGVFLLSWKSCAAKIHLLSVLPSSLGILKEGSLGILPLTPVFLARTHEGFGISQGN